MKKLVLISVLVLGSYVLAQESATQPTCATGLGRVALSAGAFHEMSYGIAKYPPSTGKPLVVTSIFRSAIGPRETERYIMLTRAETVQLNGPAADFSGPGFHFTPVPGNPKERVRVPGTLTVHIEDRKPANGGPDLPGDFYRLRFESKDHQLVYESEGVLTSGDFNLRFAP